MEFILPKHLQRQTSVAISSPSAETPDLLPFLDTTNITGPFGEMHLQQTSATMYTIYQHIFRMQQAMRLEVVIPEPMITLSYAIQGGLNFGLNGLGETQIKGGMYHLYYIPAGSYMADIPEGTTAIFQVNLHTEHIEGLSNEAIQQVLKNVLQNSRSGLQQKGATITPKVKTVLERIFSCDMEDAQRDIFLRARIYDLLLLYLDTFSDIPKEVNTKYHFTPDEIQSVQTVSTKLINILHEQIFFREIARQVHLHPRKMAEGFRLVYGVSIQEWLLQARMERAKLLLQQQSDIRQIAYEVGYNTVSGFIRAFRNFTGFTPAHYHK